MSGIKDYTCQERKANRAPEWLVSCSRACTRSWIRRNQEDGLHFEPNSQEPLRLDLFIFFIVLDQIPCQKHSQQLKVMGGSDGRVYFSNSDAEHFRCYCFAAAVWTQRRLLFGSRCFQFPRYAENVGCRKALHMVYCPLLDSTRSV